MDKQEFIERIHDLLSWTDADIEVTEYNDGKFDKFDTEKEIGRESITMTLNNQEQLKLYIDDFDYLDLVRAVCQRILTEKRSKELENGQ